MDSNRQHRVLGAREHRAAKEELIHHAANKATWAAQALEHAAGDLRSAGGGDEAFEGIAEIVLDHAERVSKLAQSIRGRRLSPEGKARDGIPA